MQSISLLLFFVKGHFSQHLCQLESFESVAKPARQFGPAMQILNHYRYSFR